MQSETGFPSSHQLKFYVASKSRLKLAALAVLSADAGLVVFNDYCQLNIEIYTRLGAQQEQDVSTCNVLCIFQQSIL